MVAPASPKPHEFGPHELNLNRPYALPIPTAVPISTDLPGWFTGRNVFPNVVGFNPPTVHVHPLRCCPDPSHSPVTVLRLGFPRMGAFYLTGTTDEKGRIAMLVSDFVPAREAADACVTGEMGVPGWIDPFYTGDAQRIAADRLSATVRALAVHVLRDGSFYLGSAAPLVRRYCDGWILWDNVPARHPPTGLTLIDWRTY